MFESVEIAKVNPGVPLTKDNPGIASARAAKSTAKRAFDIVFASLLITVLSPTLISLACLISLRSKGSSVLFSQRRTGLNGKIFRIYKFRTMTVSDDGQSVAQAQVNDARVTQFGRFLRKCSLDELPQLFNILWGDMSFVGPRPHALAHDELFSRAIPSYAQRHSVRPGLTGLAQVRGFRGEIKTIEDIEQRVDADIEYIQGWNFMSDINIILKSVPLLAGDRNAH